MCIYKQTQKNMIINVKKKEKIENLDTGNKSE